MRTPLRLGMYLVIGLLLAGCADRLAVGIERESQAQLQATVAALATDNARLAAQVAGLSTPGAASAAAATPTVQPAEPATQPAATPQDVATATGAPHPGATPTEATEPVETVPPTQASRATETAAPSPTQAPDTATPTPAGPAAAVIVESANLRDGPGTAYPVVGVARRGDRLPLLRRNRAGDWLEVSVQGRSAWLLASLATSNVAVAGLPVAVSVPPPPASPTPAPTQTPTPAPTPTLPAAPRCDMVPIRGFGKIWGDHPDLAARLGCPSGYPAPGERSTDSAYQTFEHGVMLWLAEDSGPSPDPVYALFDDGQYQRFPDLGAADPSVVEPTQTGFFDIGSRFGKAYWEGTGARVRERLGRATSPQADSAGAYQLFWSGRMVWSKELKKVFVLYDYYVYPQGQPSVRMQSWTSFDDVFGQ